MFKHAIRGVTTLPRYLSSDHDPLYRFHQWEANLRILGVTAIKTVPYIPWSHPFVERWLGTIRRECLDQLLFWTGTDLETKLIAFRQWASNARRPGGENAGRNAGIPRRGVEALRLADALSRPISDANCRLSMDSPCSRGKNAAATSELAS